METPSVSPYPSREGHRSFYPQTPAHSRTWKLRLLVHIPPRRGTGVFIHRPLHIPGHGNSIHWPVSLQGGAPEFLSTDPCTLPDMETPFIGPYPSREGLRSFYPWIPAHFQTWKLCPLAHIPSREGHWSFYPRIPAHFWTWKLHPLARIPPGRGTGVFILGSLHISGYGNSIIWPVFLQEGALEFLSMDPCTFPDMETLSVGPYPSREGHQSFYPRTPGRVGFM